ncbi:MAG: DUF922 domain-containing protein [Myxococcales bacterium]|nr:DUF922 domain-containing protein [Myxococcales bacterium]
MVQSLPGVGTGRNLSSSGTSFAARDVLRKLEKLDAEPDCDSMNREANAAANRIVEEYKAKDKAYDKETRHGATQGARFP